MNRLVAECARKKVVKLAAAAGDERHLFVWLRGSDSDAQLAMTTLPPPDPVPEIPDGIDVVWLAVGGAPGQSPAWLWRLRPPARPYGRSFFVLSGGGVRVGTRA
jgi:hypothetical protein